MKKKLFLYFFILTCIIPKSVYAYLDPSSGSYLLQLIAGIVFSSLFFLKNFWRKILNLLKFKKKRKEIK